MTILTNIASTAWRGAQFAPVEAAGLALGGGRLPMVALDFTHRAWRIAGRGVPLPMASARLDQSVMDGGERGLLIEPASSNRIFPSAVAPSGWGVNGGATIAPATGVAFAGLAGATITAGTQDWARAQGGAFALTAGAAMTVTVWLRAGTSGRARLEIFGSGINLVVSGLVGQLAPVFQQGGTVGPVSQVSLGGGVWRVRYRITPAVTVASATLGIGPSVAGGVQTVIAYAAQIESGVAATGYIATTTAAASRPADTPSLALGGWFRSTAGTIHIDLRPTAISAQTILTVTDSGGAPQMTVSCDGSGVVSLSAAGVSLVAGVPLLAGPTQALALSWGAGGSRLRLGSSTVTGPAFALPAAASLRLGPAHAMVQTLFVWDRQVQPAP
ncbi:MAG: hypothetical protein RIR62_3354 [Pseudomonadota bacterium]